MTTVTGFDEPTPTLLRLPVAYAVAIALRDAGVAQADISRAINVPVESMGSFLEIADAKLAALGGRAPKPQGDS